MYPPMEMDNGTYYMKPMNCPMHCLIFRSRQRSYRELPLRLFELGTVYRYERAGTLHGLMRIRGFTQDDSHIFCTQEQAGRTRSPALLDFVLSVLRAFGFDDFTFNLSTKDPEQVRRRPTRSGTRPPRRCARRSTRTASTYAVKEGDAAFYGPKIDIDVRDAIGRSWQLSTIQVDFNLPERFDLEYVGADNGRHRPIMLHRALFGSIERFFGVLLEHYAGAFPTWLAPVQVRVLPVADGPRGVRRARSSSALRAAGCRVDVVDADDQLGKRIRNAKLEKIPYVLVVGDDDVAAGTVGVNPRGGEVERGVAARRVRRAVPRRGRRRRDRRRSAPEHARAHLVGLAVELRQRRARSAPAATPAEPGSVFTRILRVRARPTPRPTSCTAATTCFAILQRCSRTRTGHLLVLPYREVADLDDLTPRGDRRSVGDGHRRRPGRSSGRTRPTGSTSGSTSVARPAARCREHLHVHVVPRWTGDSNFMTAIANTRTLPEALVDTGREDSAPPGRRRGSLVAGSLIRR